ncbi:hypothetical protein K504DRAFT_188279 [Pleomassaria siparia CBS 279.74]|uniref:Uncharacterized protein n=1 Tax=Pleomassaria siparia CBS 279.74 TaxID=1314801 RepID=A0A6G1JRQ3_9PLEO|nr:hypothetical protein K504DRAFT_188279 [Pleomassaria siparia CBS 279.74]
MFFNSRSLLAAALVVVGALEASAQALEFKPILDLKDYTVGPDSMKRDSTRPPLELVPISDPGFLTHGRALRRAVTGKEAFDVRSAETFYWGAYVGDNIYIANFTLSAPDDDELIMPLERFSKQLKSLKCGTPGQPIVMEFSDQESFEYALSAWDWVNKEDVNKFTLVTEPDQCYKGDNRSPYLVKTITFDKENFTANVQAEEQEWSKVARNFRLNLGHQPVPPATANVTHPHLQRREAGKEFDIAHSFNGNLFNFDVQSPTTAGMAMNADAEITTAGRILSDFDIVMESVTDIIDKIPNPDIKLPDIKLPDLNPFDKRAAGLKREVGLPKDVKLTITPQDVTASFLLKLHADGTLGKPLDWSMSPAIDIPIYGFKVGGIIEIGPFLTMSAHYGSTALEGTGDLKMGANGTLDNSAKLSVQMTDVTKNSFENWTPKITGIEPTFSAEFTGNMKAWAELALVIKAEVMGKWGYQAGFEAQLPYFQADLVGTKEPTGVCNSTKTVGIDLKASVGIDLSLQAGSVKGAAAASQSLFTTQWPLYTTCLAIGADNAKTATDATATGTDTVEPTGTEAIPTGTDATLTGTDAEDTGPIETGMPTETGVSNLPTFRPEQQD